jgi:hypothetical protein
MSTESSIISVVADAVENTTTVEGPESETADQNRHNGADHDRRMPRERFDPADVERLPCDECGSRSFEISFAVPDRNGRLIEVAPGDHGFDESCRAVHNGKS